MATPSLRDIARRLAPSARPAAAAIVLVGCLLSCSGETPSGGTQPELGSVTALGVTPSDLSLLVGDSATMTAAVQAVGAAPSGGWTVGWKSSDAAVATVTSTGVVRALRAGTATVTATAGTRSASANVVVQAVPSVDQILVSPSTLTLSAGEQSTLGASLTTSGATPAGGWKVDWSSGSPAIATVSGGVITAVSAGTTTISATAGGRTGVSTVTVLPPPSVTGIALAPTSLTLKQGQLGALTAAITTSGATPAAGWPITWQTSDSTVATLAPDASAAAILGKAVGSASITVTAGGKSASALVTVVSSTGGTTPPSGTTNIAILPSEPVFAPGNQYTITSIVTSSDAPPPAGYPVVWTSSNPAVASVPAIAAEQTLVDVKQQGTTTITASYGGKTASTTLYAATPTAITVSPATLALGVGQQAQLTTTVTATGPLPASGWPVTYTIGSPLVASVSSSGLVTGRAAGTTQLDAYAGPKRASVIVTVTGPVATVALTGSTVVQGTVAQNAGTYYLSCPNALTIAAGGVGQVLFDKQEASYDGGPFSEYVGQSVKFRTLAAGATLRWSVVAAEGFATTAQVKDFAVTFRVHYGMNASLQDYPRIAPDYTADFGFTCKAP